MTTKPEPCGGCGATSDRERCIGCLHDFGTPESAWVRPAVPVVVPERFREETNGEGYWL